MINQWIRITILTIKRQAITAMKNKLEVAIEIINQLAPVLEVYLAEENTSFEDDPSLYCKDQYGIYSMHLKRLPVTNGSLVMSYQSYVSHMDSLNPNTKIPLWSDLPDYWVNGSYVD